MPQDPSKPRNRSSQNSYLNLYLGPTKAEWDEYCRRQGKKPGAVIKAMVEVALAKAHAQPWPCGQVPRSESGPKARFEVRLLPSELAKVQERAAAEGCSVQQWLVNLVRATLTREPQFGMREIRALGESNYQLLAIGRNLNQIAKRLNEGFPEQMTVKQIEELRSAIDLHTEMASTAIRASVERWSLE